jgi:hypothetical protein
MNSETFRMKRFLRLLGTELRLNASGIGFGAAALFCVLTARWMLTESVFRDRFLSVDYGFFLLTGGFLLASLAFSDMADPVKAQSYLMLPASPLEKFLSRYLLTSWLIVAGELAVYLIFSLTAFAGRSVFGGASMPLIEPFHRLLFRSIVYFLAIHPLFFLGSILFRRWAFPKIILAQAVFSLFLYLFTAGLGRLVFRGFFFPPSETILLHGTQTYLLPAFYSSSLFVPFRWLGYAWYAIFFFWWPFWILPPLLLLAAYHRFRETELRHGIS